MNITIDDIVSRYNAKIGELTQQLVIAEARADAAETKLAEAGVDVQPEEAE